MAFRFQAHPAPAIPETTWNLFPRLTHAVELDLAVNQPGPARASGLAKVLPQRALKTLNLEGNRIGPQGAQSLTLGLPQTALTALNLTVNQIGTPGVKDLSREALLDASAIVQSHG